MSIAEYLAAEAQAATKNILWDGEVFSVEAMAGGTLDHNTLCGNVIGALHATLRGTPCRVVTSDQKLWAPLRQGFVHPDATVLCGRVERYARAEDDGWLLHPYRAGETLRVPELGIALEVDELYRLAFEGDAG